MKPRHLARVPLLLAFCAVLGAASWAGTSGPVRAPAGPWPHAGAVDAAVARYNEKFSVPGLSVVAYRGSRELYARGFGWADQQAGKKATPDTVFRLASVSKAISGVLAMDLRGDGKLALDRPIRDYVPELPAHHTYTVRQLLTHQSGVRHYGNARSVPLPADFVKPADDYYPTALLATNLFRGDALVMEPGTRAEYSTHAFTILAAAMEKVTGRPFPEWADGRFRSWGLASLRPETRQPNAARAQIYRRAGGGNAFSPRDDLSWKYAGGGLESSARDLTLLGRKLLERKILKQAELDLMWAPQSAASGPTNTALGWSVGTLSNRRLLGKDGAQNGAASYWLLLPDDGIVVSVLSNRRDHTPRLLARYVAATALLGPEARPEEFTP